MHSDLGGAQRTGRCTGVRGVPYFFHVAHGSLFPPLPVVSCPLRLFLIPTLMPKSKSTHGTPRESSVISVTYFAATQVRSGTLYRYTVLTICNYSDLGAVHLWSDQVQSRPPTFAPWLPSWAHHTRPGNLGGSRCSFLRRIATTAPWAQPTLPPRRRRGSFLRDALLGARRRGGFSLLAQAARNTLPPGRCLDQALAFWATFPPSPRPRTKRPSTWTPRPTSCNLVTF